MWGIPVPERCVDSRSMACAHPGEAASWSNVLKTKFCPSGAFQQCVNKSSVAFQFLILKSAELGLLNWRGVANILLLEFLIWDYMGGRDRSENGHGGELKWGEVFHGELAPYSLPRVGGIAAGPRRVSGDPDQVPPPLEAQARQAVNTGEVG